MAESLFEGSSLVKSFSISFGVTGGTNLALMGGFNVLHRSASKGGKNPFSYFMLWKNYLKLQYSILPISLLVLHLCEKQTCVWQRDDIQCPELSWPEEMSWSNG